MRDLYDLALVEAFEEAGKPIFGVCRGLQLINVAAGGTLIQDIPAQVPAAVSHQLTTPLDAIAHGVTIARDSVLARALQPQLGAGRAIEVNSRHHQSPSQIGQGFVVSATAEDGVIEAIERPESRFCVGVQWHPENFWRRGTFRSLFESFIEAASQP